MIEAVVSVGDRELSITHPPDAAALIDEEAFAREEFLPYWAELWPSGVALARRVAGATRRGERVVELGCGLGLASISAALAGARVLATDWSRDALAFTARNAERNGAAVETALVSWDSATEVTTRAPWDVVLASDLLYENRNVPLLAELLEQLVDERGRVQLAEPGRPQARLFFERLAGTWQVDELPRDREHPQVRLYELRRSP